VSDGPQVLIADARPSTRATLEPLLRRAGWAVLAVSSCVEVLRAIRDHPVDVLLIDPELPGAGLSGVDVVRTLGASTRWRSFPVLFLVHGDRASPSDAAAIGTLDLDRLGAHEVLAKILDVLVRAVVPEMVREIAQKVVPDIAERVIREEIARLRREHGLG